jgi:hypothetical protein
MHGQTLADRTNLGQVFNSRSGCMCAAHLLYPKAKRPNLKLKTRPKQLIGSVRYRASRSLLMVIKTVKVTSGFFKMETKQFLGRITITVCLIFLRLFLQGSIVIKISCIIS